MFLLCLKFICNVFQCFQYKYEINKKSNLCIHVLYSTFKKRAHFLLKQKLLKKKVVQNFLLEVFLLMIFLVK